MEEDYVTPEELAHWEMSSFEIDSWLRENDSASFVFQKLDQFLYLSIVRSDDGLIGSRSISLTGINADGEELEIAEFYFHEPEPLESSPYVETEMVDQITESLMEWRYQVEQLAIELGPIAWIPATGRRIPDRPYVLLAALFDYLQRNGTSQVVEVCTALTGASYETTKSRIRYSRERGFLSKPGHGASEKSKLTKLGIQSIQEELGL